MEFKVGDRVVSLHDFYGDGLERGKEYTIPKKEFIKNAWFYFINDCGAGWFCYRFKLARKEELLNEDGPES